jgi:hypothetical protein
MSRARVWGVFLFQQRRQFVGLVIFRPAPQDSNRVADVGARTVDAAADQLELGDQPVISFQELIAFLGESLVEYFELVDPTSQADDFTFDLCTASSYSERSRRSSA